MDVRRISHDLVKPFQSAGSREHVALKDGQNKEWWGAFDGEALLGFAFLMVRAGHARIGGIFFLPEHRGRGEGKAFMEWLIAEAKRRNVSMIDLFTVYPPFWASKGFKAVRSPRNGITHMRRAV